MVAKNLKIGQFVQTNTNGEGFTVVDVFQKGDKVYAYDFGCRPHQFDKNQTLTITKIPAVAAA